MSTSLTHTIVLLFYLVTCPIFGDFPSHSESYPDPYYEVNVEIHPEKNLIKTQMKLIFGKELIKNGKLTMLVGQNSKIHSLKGPDISTFETDTNRGLKQISINLSDTTKDRYEMLVNYSVVIPEDHQVNRVTEDWIELNIDSFWLPLITTFPTFQYDMDLKIKGDYQVITGDLITHDSAGVNHIKSRIPRIDIPFSAAPDFILKTGEFVSVYSPTANTKMDSVLILADDALQFLSSYIDQTEDFSHKRKVILSPRKDVGYSRKNYVVLSDISDMSSLNLSRFLAHEFSHYWFSEANINSKNHWLSESFAEYLSLIYLREEHGQQFYQINLEEKRERIAGDQTPLSEYEERPSYLALYIKGPIILSEFEQYLGSDSFKKLMNYFVDNKIATNEELFEAINTLFGTGALEKLKDLRATI